MISRRFAILILGLFAFPILSFSANPVERSEYWRQRVSLFDKLPVTPNDIVFLGNSITDGGEFAELFNNPKIKNRGINSDEISGVTERVGQILSGSPSKIFLLIGINDVSHNLSVETLRKWYENLVRKIRKESPETKLYLQSVMPINNDFGRYKNLKDKEQTIILFNKEIKKIAAENDAKYVDLWNVLTEAGSDKLKPAFTNDGLHLTGDGYVAWVDYIKQFVEE